MFYLLTEKSKRLSIINVVLNLENKNEPRSLIFKLFPNLINYSSTNIRLNEINTSTYNSK